MLNRLRVVLIIIAIVGSSLCYIYGYLRQTENAIYTGMRGINASDYNTHLSWIDQSRQGHFFLQNKFTAEPQRGDLVRPIYFLLSQPFRLTSLANSTVFHILRIFCGAVLLVLLFTMLRQYDSDPVILNRAFLLLAFTSGLGFLTRQWMASADMDIPETTLFVSLGEAPHFLYSLLFLWAGIAAFFAGLTAIFFVCLLLLWWEHPFEAVILIAVCTANLWTIKGRKNQILILLITAGISLPPFFYFQYLKKLPAFSGWGSAQNVMNSPPIYSYVSGFLPLILLAVLGVRFLWDKPDKRKTFAFLSIWAVVQFVLVYLPFPFQRRLIAGWQFPLALLGAYGLHHIRKPGMVVLLIALLSFSNVLITKRLIDALRPRQMPFYVTSYYASAFQWLADQKDKNGVVLSGFVTGNLIPGFAGFTSYLGHSSLTPEISKKREEVAAFYRNPTMAFVFKNRVRYIFWGMEERHLSEIDLSEQFGIAFENEQVTILDPLRKVENRTIAAQRSKTNTKRQ